MQQAPSSFIGGRELLEALWSPGCRPSEGWLKEQRRMRRIPFMKVGRKVFYDLEQVRRHLEERGQWRCQ